jgi:hypothetical protein
VGDYEIYSERLNMILAECDGKIIAWSSAGTHIFETGGISPGGMIANAKSRYDEFEKEWLKKKPPEDQLTYYGSWPDAKMVTPIIRI